MKEFNMLKKVFSIATIAAVGALGFFHIPELCVPKLEAKEAKEVPVEFKWETDFDKFKDVGGFRLLLFTAENWCPYCKKLNKNILVKKEFQDLLSKKITCFKIDLENGGDARMLQVFKARAFPTLILIDPEGNKIAEFGYRKQFTPESFAKFINDFLPKE